MIGCRLLLLLLGPIRGGRKILLWGEPRHTIIFLAQGVPVEYGGRGERMLLLPQLIGARERGQIALCLGSVAACIDPHRAGRHFLRLRGLGSGSQWGRTRRQLRRRSVRAGR